MFHREAICQKRMVIPENQFNYKQIQDVKYIETDLFNRN